MEYRNSHLILLSEQKTDRLNKINLAVNNLEQLKLYLTDALAENRPKYIYNEEADLVQKFKGRSKLKSLLIGKEKYLYNIARSQSFLKLLKEQLQTN